MNNSFREFNRLVMVVNHIRFKSYNILCFGKAIVKQKDNEFNVIRFVCIEISMKFSDNVLNYRPAERLSALCKSLGCFLAFHPLVIERVSNRLNVVDIVIEYCSE